MRFPKLAAMTLCLAVPGPLLAQQLPASMVAAAASGSAPDDRDDGNPRLQLLGLLGLIGLLGLFRPEPNIHVDARRTRRP